MKVFLQEEVIDRLLAVARLSEVGTKVSRDGWKIEW
jgi:hypothetical protein